MYIPMSAILAGNVFVICAFAVTWRRVWRMARKEDKIDERLEVLQRAIDDAEEMKRRVGCQMKKLDRTLRILVPLADRIAQVLRDQP